MDAITIITEKAGGELARALLVAGQHMPGDTDYELDLLLLAASKLLRNDKDFQRLLENLEAEAALTPLISNRSDGITWPSQHSTDSHH